MPYRQTVTIDSSMIWTGSVVDWYFTPWTYSSDGRYLYEWDTTINEVDFKMTLLSDAKLRLYSCKIYQNWTAFHDFVPCYRKSDWEIWLYDLVSDTFYTNQWSWTFTKWPPLWCKSIKKVYKWSTLIRPELPLKEFTEICSISTYTDALTELNKYPQEYYQKFLTESNIIKFNFNSSLYDTLKWTESWWVRYPKYREDWGNYYILIYDINQLMWWQLQIQ